ncbi:MAG: hypothetical protein ACOYOU_12190 [Kiritimatiellia bacterium]
MISYARCWIALAIFSLSAAAEPVRMLPPPPGQIMDLRANAAGDLYIRTATDILHLSLTHSEDGWKALALGPVVDLTENAGRDVFARQDAKTRFAIYRLAGAKAIPVTTTPNGPCEQWYVDALGRAWLQNRERLLVVGREKTLLDRPARWDGFNGIRAPCEWRPGHVVLLYGSEAVYATPEKFATDPAPLFSGDAFGAGPFRLGQDHLLGGCDRKSFRVSSCRFDPSKPDQPPEPLKLGWDWFDGVATAPDGRLLVLGQTDRNPQFTLFWYAADGQREVRLKGTETIIRAGPDPYAIRKARVVFATNSVGFAATPNGMLAVLRPDEATLVTPALGLPIPRVEHLAAVGDDLIMAGGGKLVAWRTAEPLRPDPALADKREWELAGPCLRDRNGTMWTFLLDFPGKLSRHDGQQWHHLDIELGNSNPRDMSTDDLGRLQIGGQDGASNFCQLADGLLPGGTNAPTRAWFGPSKSGPASLVDGSPFRPQHVATGKTNECWLHNGRMFSDGEQTYDYPGSPPYSYYWLGLDGTCYRGGAGRLWVYAGGRWTETEAPPMSVGPDGITAGTGPGRLPVVYDGQPKLLLARPTEFPESRTPRTVPLQGNEAFIPGPGGGWVGSYRVFRNAYYSVAGRVYPGTNWLYMVANNTLRFQPRQTLTVTGEVACTGDVRRLVCRIAGNQPLFKPRLLTFVDGEFNDSIASPDGGSIPPLKPGAHALEVYAADGFGVVSEQPLRLTLDGGPECEVVNLEMGEDWRLQPRRLQVLPTKIAGRSVLGRALEIDSDGVVWILVEDGVMAIEPVKRQAAFHHLPAQELVAARGRVWALGNYDRNRLQMPVYELRRAGPQHAVDLYDDLPRSKYGPQLAADTAGGIWTLGHRIAVRWDGQRTQYWEREVGFNATVLSLPDGAVIQCPGVCFVYRNGELGPAISWSTGDEYRDSPLYTLGRNHLVMPRHGAIIVLDSGRILDRKSPPGECFKTDATGNLYIWNKGQFSRFSGDDLTETKLTSCPQPAMPPLHDSGGYEFLATTNGVVTYTVGADRIIMGRANEGMTEYGWREGILPGLTRAIRAAPDKRLWILRKAQLLLCDPAQPAETIPSAWTGWRAAPVQGRFEVGAFGHVWYHDPDRRVMVCTDGTNEVTWAMKDRNGAIVVGDHGEAAVFVGSDTYFLATNKPVERLKDPASAALELVKRGAKSFEGDGAPAVAADGRVYFRGKIWDGQTWRPAPDGRASLDVRGEIYLLCFERSSLPVAYRLEGIKPVPLGQVEKCLIDAYGLRWYDPGILEANPGCMPVWYASKETPQLSSDANGTRARIDSYGSLQAFPLGDGEFLVRVGAKLHRLNARGISAIPGTRIPCGDELDPNWGLRVWRLANGRWALAVFARLFISPADLSLNP